MMIMVLYRIKVAVTEVIIVTIMMMMMMMMMIAYSITKLTTERENHLVRPRM